MEPNVEIITVTPEMAHEWLARNQNNRNIRQTKVDAMARDMKAGKWKLNGMPLIFNGTGRLLDGQHRLLACVKSNVSFSTSIARGVSDAAHPTIDVGATRTLGDELRWRGEKDVNSLAASLMLYWRFQNDDLPHQNLTPTRSELLGVLARRGDMRDWLPKAKQVAKGIRMIPTPLIVGTYLLMEEHGPETADQFLLHLGSGIDYQEGDACLLLRNAVIRQSGVRGYRTTTPEWLALVIKAANYWLLGRPITFLRWRGRGGTKEPFPVILGKDEVIT